MLTASPVSLGFRDSRPSPNVPSPLRRPATAGALTSRSTRRKGRSRTSSRGSPPLVTASAAARSPSPDPLVRHTLFTHGEGRHGVDPRLVQRATPAAAGPPALHATRKRVIGMGFGAATANRGLMPAPEARRPTRRRRRGKRSAKKKQPAEATTTQPEQQQQQQAADSHAYHKYDAAIAQAKQAKAAIAAELQHLLKSPSSLARTPKTVMISTAARSSPSTWSGNAKGGRDSPAPNEYTPPDFVHMSRKSVKPTSGTFGSANRGNDRDPGCFLQRSETPPPNTYWPSMAAVTHSKGTPSFHGKLEHGSIAHELRHVASPGPVYYPNPESPTTTFQSSPSCGFGFGQRRLFGIKDPEDGGSSQQQQGGRKSRPSSTRSSPGLLMRTSRSTPNIVRSRTTQGSLALKSPPRSRLVRGKSSRSNRTGITPLSSPMTAPVRRSPTPSPGTGAGAGTGTRAGREPSSKDNGRTARRAAAAAKMETSTDDNDSLHATPRKRAPEYFTFEHV